MQQQSRASKPGLSDSEPHALLCGRGGPDWMWEQGFGCRRPWPPDRAAAASCRLVKHR